MMQRERGWGNKSRMWRRGEDASISGCIFTGPMSNWSVCGTWHQLSDIDTPLCSKHTTCKRSLTFMRVLIRLSWARSATRCGQEVKYGWGRCCCVLNECSWCDLRFYIHLHRQYLPDMLLVLFIPGKNIWLVWKQNNVQNVPYIQKC